LGEIASGPIAAFPALITKGFYYLILAVLIKPTFLNYNPKTSSSQGTVNIDLEMN